MREDGGIKVINHGFDTKSKKWKEAEGKAYFVENPNVGFLKVSFLAHFMVHMSSSTLTMRLTQ
jgi:apolipoprotein D and lipocalin family protein